MPKIIIRLPDGTSESILDSLETQLQGQGYNSFRYEYYKPTENTDYAHLAQKRKQSLLNAFIYFSKATPTKKTPFDNEQNLKKLIANLKHSINESHPELNQDIQSSIDNLAQFKTLIINIMMSEWGLTKEEAEEQLNIAEQYHIMEMPRSAVMTIVTISSSPPPGTSSRPSSPDISESAQNTKYLAIQDTPIKPFHPDTLAELKALREKYSNKISHVEVGESDPSWFQEMSYFEKRCLIQMLIQYQDWESWAWLPPRQRRIPGVANLENETFLFLDNEGNLIDHLTTHPIVRASHPSSRDASSQTSQQTHTSRNVTTIATKLILTLISPVHYLGLSDKKVNSALKQHRTNASPLVLNIPVNNGDLVEKAQAITGLPLIETNSKEALDAFISTLTTAMNGMDSLEPLLKQYQYFEDKKNPGFMQLTVKMIKSLYSWAQNFFGEASKSRDDVNDTMRLKLAALIATLAHQCKIPISIHCISGKDRTAVIMMLIAAIITYYKSKGVWPDFVRSQTDEMNFFYSIFVSIFKSGHHQHLSAQGAEGVLALKNLFVYLPDILKQELGDSNLRAEDKFADFNETKRIPHTEEICNNYVLKTFIRQNLSWIVQPEHENTLQTLMNLVQHTLTNEDFWSSQTFRSATMWKAQPAGIDTIDLAIRTQLRASKLTPEESLDLLVQLAVIGLDKCNQNTWYSTRSETTQKMYQALSALAHPSNALIPVTTIAGGAAAHLLTDDDSPMGVAFTIQELQKIQIKVKQFYNEQQATLTQSQHI